MARKIIGHAKPITKRGPSFPFRTRGYFDASPWGGGYVPRDAGPGAVRLRDDLLMDMQTGEVWRDDRFAPDGSGVGGLGTVSARVLVQERNKLKQLAEQVRRGTLPPEAIDAELESIDHWRRNAMVRAVRHGPDWRWAKEKQQLLQAAKQAGILYAGKRTAFGALPFSSSGRGPLLLGGLLLGWLWLRGRRASAAESPGSSSPGTPSADVLPGSTIPIPQGSVHVVGAGDSLSSIARRAYGEWRWWPHLWDVNRVRLGATPDLLQIGAAIAVPQEGALPTARRQAHFARAEKHLAIWKAWTQAGRAGRPALPKDVLDAPAATP